MSELDQVMLVKDKNGKSYLVKRIVSTSQDGCKIVVQTVYDKVITVEVC